MSKEMEMLKTKLYTIKEIAIERGEYGMISEAEQALSDLNIGRFNIAFVGQYKRGKSSIINALLNRKLLPTDVTPLTSAITVLQYGEKEIGTVIYHNGAKEEIPLANLALYVSEEGNPSNFKGVREVQIDLRHPLLEKGIRLVDTPGVGSVFESNDRVTQSYLPKIDVAVVVLGIEPPIGAEEIKMVKNIRGSADKLIFVVNKIDVADEKTLEKAEIFTKKILNEALKLESVSILCLSAIKAMDNEKEERMCHFREQLENLSYQSRTTLVMNSASRAISYLSERMLQQVKLEKMALLVPLSDLDSRIERFQVAMRDIEDLMLALITRMKSEASYDWKQWNKEKEEMVSSAKSKILSSLKEKCMGFTKTKTRIRHFVLEEARKETMAFLEQWKSHVYEWITSRYKAQIVKVNDEMNRLLARIATAIFESFGIDLARFEFKPLSLNLDKISFDFPLHVLALDLSEFFLTLIDLFLPRTFIISQSCRQINENIEDWTIRNMYQIEEKVIQWIDHSNKQIFESMQAQFQSVRKEIFNALASGRKKREEGAEKIKEHLNKLDAQEKKIEAMLNKPKEGCA